MSISSHFLLIIEVVFFLVAIWVVGRLCRFIKISPLIGEIIVGMFLGPQALAIVPKVTKDAEGNYESLWQILGTLGVTLMIAESGTHIHFNKLKKVGISAVGVAIVGTFLPLGTAMALSMLFGWNTLASFAAGCALAPTSVGVALKLLTDAKQLNSLAGQTIVTAAFLDDVFSIILLVVLRGFAGNNSSSFSYVDIILRFIYCFLFLGIGVLLAVSVFANYFPILLKIIPQNVKLNHQPRDEIHLLCMIAVLAGYSFIGDQIGSHLLGAFIAGMSFSQVSRSMFVWRRQLKRICAWLVRFFFACSVAFTIPVDSLFSIEACWKGFVLAIVSGVISKVLAGFVAYENRYVVGFAMVGRGEFAYLIAQSAKSFDIIDSRLYATIVWALLIAVFVAPLSFRKVLKMSFASVVKSGVKYFTIQAEGQHHTGIHFEIVDVLHNLKLDILEAKVETDGDVDMSEFIVGIADGDLDGDKIQDILHDIREAVGEDAAQVQVLPVDETDILSLIKGNVSCDTSNIGWKYNLLNNFRSLTNTNVKTNMSNSLTTDIKSPKSISDGNRTEIRITSLLNQQNNGQYGGESDSPGNKNSKELEIKEDDNTGIKQNACNSSFNFPLSNNTSIVEQNNSFHHPQQSSFLNMSLMSNNNETFISDLSMNTNNTELYPYYIELKIMSAHSTRIFNDMINILQDFDIRLIKGHMEDYLDTDSEVIFGQMSYNTHKQLNMFELKTALKNVFLNLNVKGKVMVKRIRKDSARLPHHMKFSELLKTSLPSNPLLFCNSESKDNNSCNGYEIELICEDRIQNAILNGIANSFQMLTLDIRTIHIEDDYQQHLLSACFFVQESNIDLFNPNLRRHAIEDELTKLFRKLQIAARIKIRAIELGKDSANDSPSLKLQPSTAVITSSTTAIAMNSTQSVESNDSCSSILSTIESMPTLITDKYKSDACTDISTSVAVSEEYFPMTPKSNTRKSSVTATITQSEVIVTPKFKSIAKHHCQQKDNEKYVSTEEKKAILLKELQKINNEDIFVMDDDDNRRVSLNSKLDKSAVTCVRRQPTTFNLITLLNDNTIVQRRSCSSASAITRKSSNNLNICEPEEIDIVIDNQETETQNSSEKL